MKGRGVRVMPTDDLQRVTRDAPAQDPLRDRRCGRRDRNGNDRHPATVGAQTVGRRSSKLIEQVAWGNTEPATLSSLAFRLSKLDKVHLALAAGTSLRRSVTDKSLTEIVQHLIRASDPDAHIDRARALAGLPTGRDA